MVSLSVEFPFIQLGGEKQDEHVVMVSFVVVFFLLLAWGFSGITVVSYWEDYRWY